MCVLYKCVCNSLRDFKNRDFSTLHLQDCGINVSGTDISELNVNVDVYRKKDFLLNIQVDK